MGKDCCKSTVTPFGDFALFPVVRRIFKRIKTRPREKDVGRICFLFGPRIAARKW
jgi:hypothetical protein